VRHLREAFAARTGVIYKTAYRMSQLIRQRLMPQDAEPFKGREPVEVDET
jgi:hypothetical protein